MGTVQRLIKSWSATGGVTESTIPDSRSGETETNLAGKTGDDDEEVTILPPKGRRKKEQLPILPDGRPLLEMSSLEWLNVLNGGPFATPEADYAVLDDTYFQAQDQEHSTRNRHLVFSKGNRYENWMMHAAIPLVFSHFVCNPKYVSRGELALYIRLLLFMDQYGICYPSYDQLKVGLYSQGKQVSPVINALVHKHLVLRYSGIEADRSGEGKVQIPWLGRGHAKMGRHVYQRPSTAYTLAKLHYVGYADKDPARLKFMDVRTFGDCVSTLAAAYRSRMQRTFLEAGESGMKQAYWKLKEMDALPKFSERIVQEWLFETFLTNDEKARVELDRTGFFNAKAKSRG